MFTSGVQIKGTKCVWCENGCTAKNPAVKCEPKNWLEKQGDAKDYEICPSTTNPYHTYTKYGRYMTTNLEGKWNGGTGGLSKCYSKDSCLNMLITQNGWITSPRCTTCGRRRADIEYVTMTLEVDASLHMQLFPEENDRRRFHNPTFQEEEMTVASFMIPFLKDRRNRRCVDTHTSSACALNADICIRMECDNAGFKPDWTQQKYCWLDAGFFQTMCV